MSRWTSEYATGITICAVCGLPKNGKTRCCQTAPYLDYATFCRTYFAGEENQNPLVAREFWQDYLLSDCKSLKQYVGETTESACA